MNKIQKWLSVIAVSNILILVMLSYHVDMLCYIITASWIAVWIGVICGLKEVYNGEEKKVRRISRV